MYLSDPMVSVIVPVYNAESTLRRCADSILEQSYPDLELILVDDGSKDASPLICDSYMQKDARIRVIHKPNSGASATRNLGIAEARGRYLQFVDSSIWSTCVSPGTLSLCHCRCTTTFARRTPLFPRRTA